MIFMAKNIANCLYFYPFDSGVPIKELVGQMAHCFRNDLNCPFRRKAQDPIIGKLFKGTARTRVSNRINRIENIHQHNTKVAHQNTRIACCSMVALSDG